jgi:hypothetical protein
LTVTCITIIDTIILTNYTNDAFTYDTYTVGAALIKETCVVHSAAYLTALWACTRYTYTYTHIHIYTYTHIHIYTYTY